MQIAHVIYRNPGNVFWPKRFDETSRAWCQIEIPLGACYGQNGHNRRNGTQRPAVCLLSQTSRRNLSKAQVPTRGAGPEERLLGAAGRGDVWLVGWVSRAAGPEGRQQSRTVKRDPVR